MMGGALCVGTSKSEQPELILSVDRPFDSLATWLGVVGVGGGGFWGRCTPIFRPNLSVAVFNWGISPAGNTSLAPTANKSQNFVPIKLTHDFT